MSRFTHRQPVWGTISVVLLSALFLSPMTGAALLHALALDAAWYRADAATLPIGQSPAAGDRAGAPEQTTAPRRTSEEDEAALRRAAEELREQLRNLRLHAEPGASLHRLAPDTFVVYLPTRAVILVPDEPRSAWFRPRDRAVAPRDGAVRPAPPRAPPILTIA